MNLPPTFSTQCLGAMQRHEHGYRPTNHNAFRFFFEPGTAVKASTWPTLIDGRVPFLNAQWPSLLAHAARDLKAVLATLGQSSLSKGARLQHLTLRGDGSAILLISLSESEEGLSLEVTVDAQDRITAITPTR